MGYDETARTDADRLSDLFLSFLRYMPTTLWFGRFFEDLKRQNPHASLVSDTVEEVTTAIWMGQTVSRQNRQSLGSLPTKKHGIRIPREMIVADAVIRSPKTMIIVELGHEREFEAERIFQHVALSHQIELNPLPHVLFINDAETNPVYASSKYSGRSGSSVQVDPTDTLEKYVATRMRDACDLDIDESTVKSRLLWMGWPDVLQMISHLELDADESYGALDEPFKAGISRLLTDLVYLLRRNGHDVVKHDVISALSQFSIQPDALPILDFEKTTEVVVKPPEIQEITTEALDTDGPETDQVEPQETTSEVTPNVASPEPILSDEGGIITDLGALEPNPDDIPDPWLDAVVPL